MSETMPRDVTPEEVEHLATPGVAPRDSAPSRIPPGTQIAAELLDPRSAVGAPAAPTAGPEEAADASGRGRPTDAPARQPPRRR
jgi:hypothetical protein